MATKAAVAPVELENVLVGSVTLRADRRRLSDFLARTLNADQVGAPVFEVVGDEITLYAIIDHASNAQTTSPFTKRTIFVTTRVRREGEARELVFCLYAFVGDFGLLSSLREEFGSQAWWADISLDRGGWEFELDVMTPVYPGDDPTWRAECILAITCQSFSPKWTSLRGFRPISAIHLLQIREAARPESSRLRKPVVMMIEATEVMMIEPTDVTMQESNIKAAVTLGKASRSIDLVADFGLDSYSIATNLTLFECSTLTFAFEETTAKKLPRSTSARGPLPTFIETRLDPRTPPPYAFENVAVKGFKFKASPARLQLLVDALLNTNEILDEPRQNFTYKIATAEVVLELIHYDRMRSTAPETRFRRKGDFTSQDELVLRLLVGTTEEDSGTATDPRVFCPFLFVNNWASMVSGREVMGLWKRMADFEVEAEDSRPASEYRCCHTVRQASTARSQAEGISRKVRRSEAKVRSSGDFVLTVDHAPLHEFEGTRRPIADLRGSAARGVLPWTQEDFLEGVEYRRDFARNWLKVSGQEFVTLQRTYLPRPDGDRPYRQWIEARYSIRNFRILQPSRMARLTLGQFNDPGLAKLLTNKTKLGDLDPADSGISAQGTIQIAQLLGVKSPVLEVAAGSWYDAIGDFQVEVIDPYV